MNIPAKDIPEPGPEYQTGYATGLCEGLEKGKEEREQLQTEIELYSRHRVKLQAEVEKWVAYTLVHGFDEMENCPTFYDYCRCSTPENTQERLNGLQQIG